MSSTAYSLHDVKQLDAQVTAIDLSAMTLTVQSKKKKKIVLHVESSTMIMKNKAPCSFEDIKVRDRVRVKYTEINGHNVAKSILVVSQ